MRIAYISLHWPRTVASSVGQKIARQMASWRAAGHEVSFFSHMHTMKEEQELVRGKYFVYDQHHGLIGRIRTEFSRMYAAKELVEAVKAYQPDLIYLRWSMYVYPIHRLMDIAPVVVEINTNDVEEHKLLGLIPNAYNRLTRGLILGNAKGYNFATEELSKLDEFTKYHKPLIIISNSSDLKITPYLPAPANLPPHLVFIGSAGMPWHGVEKLIGFARKYPDIVIDVIGYDYYDVDIKNNPPKNIIFHGYKSGDQLLQILSNADCAISTMSYHSIGLLEASPLKTRQYLGLGIPTIIPYHDMDLFDLDSEFLLKIPNEEKNVEEYGQTIHDFVFAMRGRRIPRELIFERIDISVKEAQRLEFFQKVIEESKDGKGNR